MFVCCDYRVGVGVSPAQWLVRAPDIVMSPSQVAGGDLPSRHLVSEVSLPFGMAVDIRGRVIYDRPPVVT